MGNAVGSILFLHLFSPEMIDQTLHIRWYLGLIGNLFAGSGMDETKSIGMQSLAVYEWFLLLFRGIVLVADQRVSFSFKLNPDLVFKAGIEIYLEEGSIGIPFPDLKRKMCRRCLFFPGINHDIAESLAYQLEMVMQLSLVFIDDSSHQGQITALRGVVFKLAEQMIIGFLVFGKNHQAACVAIYPVNRSHSNPVFSEVFSHQVEKVFRIAVGNRYRQEPGRLVHHKKVPVLVNNVELPSS